MATQPGHCRDLRYWVCCYLGLNLKAVTSVRTGLLGTSHRVRSQDGSKVGDRWGDLTWLVHHNISSRPLSRHFIGPKQLCANPNSHFCLKSQSKSIPFALNPNPNPPGSNLNPALNPTYFKACQKLHVFDMALVCYKYTSITEQRNINLV